MTGLRGFYFWFHLTYVDTQYLNFHTTTLSTCTVKRKETILDCASRSLFFVSQCQSFTGHTFSDITPVIYLNVHYWTSACPSRITDEARLLPENIYLLFVTHGEPSSAADASPQRNTACKSSRYIVIVDVIRNFQHHQMLKYTESRWVSHVFSVSFLFTSSDERYAIFTTV